MELVPSRSLGAGTWRGSAPPVARICPTEPSSLPSTSLWTDTGSSCQGKSEAESRPRGSQAVKVRSSRGPSFSSLRPAAYFAPRGGETHTSPQDPVSPAKATTPALLLPSFKGLWLQGVTPLHAQTPCPPLCQSADTGPVLGSPPGEPGTGFRAVSWLPVDSPQLCSGTATSSPCAVSSSVT